MLALAAEDKGLQLRLTLDDDVPPRLRGDPTRLGQIVVNLANNAIKFTEQGEVAVVASLGARTAAGVTLRVEVVDTGMGIPPDRLDRLFRSFSQVDASTTREHGGTGLGLAIAKRLAELMGGRIGVRSKPGEGSTFWFTANLAWPETEARVQLDGRTLLVAHGEASARARIVRALDDSGARCRQTAGVESALGTLREAAGQGHPFDALVVCETLADEAPALTTECHTDPLLSDLRIAVVPAEGDDVCIATLVGRALVEPRDDALAPTPPDTRILVAEDNAVNQTVARRTLESLGYDVDVVSDGVAAVDAVSGKSYALVLMDCQMPGLDGYEATRAIRSLPDAAARTPIVAMTASALDGDRQRCLDAGMDDYVTKPFDTERLADCVTRWTSRRDDDVARDVERPVMPLV